MDDSADRAGGKLFLSTLGLRATQATQVATSCTSCIVAGVAVAESGTGTFTSWLPTCISRPMCSAEVLSFCPWNACPQQAQWASAALYVSEHQRSPGRCRGRGAVVGIPILLPGARGPSVAVDATSSFSRHRRRMGGIQLCRGSLSDRAAIGTALATILCGAPLIRAQSSGAWRARTSVTPWLSHLSLFLRWCARILVHYF